MKVKKERWRGKENTGKRDKSTRKIIVKRWGEKVRD
jgi:hypothetical protein